MSGVANNSKSSFPPFTTKTSNHSTDNIGEDTSGSNCTCTNNNNSEWMCLFIIVMYTFYVDSINTSSLIVSIYDVTLI